MATSSSARERPQRHVAGRRRAGAVVLAVLGGGLAVASCGGDEGGNTASFCAAVDEHRAELFGRMPEPVTAEATAAYIDLVTSVGESAPLEIEPHWDAWVLTLETFAEGADMEEIKATGFASQKSAIAIDKWLQANCGAGVGVPIGTVPPLGAAASTAAPAG